MPVTLVDIPVLGFAYKFKKIAPLAAGTEPRHPYNASLLDRVSVYQGDITKLEVDAIVNAANTSLLGGGGVDGQIHRAAGPDLVKECKTLHGCETGQTKITKGYRLPSKHVLHTVGPVYSRSEKDTKAEQLRSCYRTCLDLTVANSLEHVAFCAVSTGIYGYPIEDATHIAMDEVRTYLESEKGKKIERVIFCVWSDKDKSVYEELVPFYFPASQDAEETKESDKGQATTGETEPEPETSTPSTL